MEIVTGLGVLGLIALGFWAAYKKAQNEVAAKDEQLKNLVLIDEGVEDTPISKEDQREVDKIPVSVVVYPMVKADPIVEAYLRDAFYNWRKQGCYKFNLPAKNLIFGHAKTVGGDGRSASLEKLKQRYKLELETEKIGHRLVFSNGDEKFAEIYFSVNYPSRKKK